MAEVLDAPYTPELDEELEENIAGSNVGARQDITRRQFEQAKKQAIKKSEQVAERQFARLAAKTSTKVILRILNGAFAVTVVGIIVTYLIMTFQFIAGNWLGNESVKLDSWEVIIWGFLTLFLIVLLIGIFILFIILIAIALEPVAAISALGLQVFETLRGIIP
ncbi:hypothetical protein KKH39_02330 [Patescibacteria group bacterium]|nr:hypothetical protein [Patescibacteria group bacterium]